ncbi:MULTISPECIES: TrpB-like pyridoxal phosphate-dependent enzyme [Syntrophothermus]|uniref:Tryptophan synthase beta chain n=1 Tax=Syntrophothermus lipocalidus (strain DSM 12680 / TGB-C1) TaxID=643648 RepID=D7CKT3_SYNLT|nr:MULTISPECIES: TrpB-like pyridoxal phosphate-dependent enzyme [Syntrophothermus]ADI01318.1 pyridoxal-phosphate dependent TrpB-like enzyme [Syntrophothermus lipocalidus DSM 12680]NSW82317.1 TrpB-like pyridoxal phosphate-dependent enzyme [Syntrophothermus sp.]
MSRDALTKIILPEDKIPKYWYNVQADMPNPLDPPLNPRTGEPATPDDLLPIFPMGLIEQEVSQERYIEIPQEVREIYRLWRPSPLYRAHRLEKALDTPCRIYYKYEGVSPVGSHKLNSAIAQAFFNKIAGIKRLTTETGAGQWGTALALACRVFGLDCTVYMVKVSYEQKPYRRSIMETYGATCLASPTDRTASGRAVLERDPDTPGTLAIAISEAVEDAASRDDTNYSLGSVLNHVCLHQTVIGQEVKLQLEMVDEYPDVVIGCCGGGSNFSGIALPFIPDKLAGTNVRLIAVEPAACPTLTKGVFAYDYGDQAGFTPLLKMYTLGHDFTPPGIHAGGLRYHGDSPLISRLYHDGLLEARAVFQKNVFEAAVLFAQTEGILPAPESAHAIRAAVDEALAGKEEGVSRCIVFNLSGHGHLDISAYDSYLNGRIEDVEFSDEALAESLKTLPQV